MIKKLFLNDKFILLLILLNAIILFIGGYINSENHNRIVLLFVNLITAGSLVNILEF